MQFKIYKKQKGFIALLSVLIVSAIGLAIGVSLLLLGTGSLRTAFNIQQSDLAKAYANHCSEEALMNIASNSTYSGSATINLSNGSCTYTVTHGFQNETIDATGTVQAITRKTHITLDTTGFLWQEVP